ncbi:MAG: IcmT/TraK family protein [Desulfovibrionaceae bacterium]|nr:IcmT/TraK family protein [Desulfovibrionaceae bacterium]
MTQETFSSQINWRDTARPVRFFMFDARVLWGLLIWAFHMCVETFCIAVAGILIFAIIDFFGLTPMAALRTLKNQLFGKRHPVIGFYLQRRRAQW